MISVCLSLFLLVYFENEVSGLKDGALVHVETLLKENVYMPCNTSSTDGDEVALILWYKENKKSTPIYSFDNREVTNQFPKRWSDPSTFGERASFSLEESPASLLIKNVQEADSGLYRCRVDFFKSQTRNSRVNLTVIVPPHSIIIRDETGAERSTVVGPYNEGEIILLKCEVTGGIPTPTINWYRDGILVDSTMNFIRISHIESTVKIGPLSRKDFNSKLTCRATSHPQLPAMESAVQVDMNFAPLNIQLLGAREPLSAGRRYDLLCQSAGARPPAIITWWMNGTRLEKTSETTSSDGNQTTSTLSIILTKAEVGKYLSCRAYNQAMPSFLLEDGWVLDVQYPPETQIILGPSLDSNFIKEGTDVYFNCLVDAHPPVFRLDWKRNNQPLPRNISQGVVISNHSLVLQGVVRDAAGNYSCVGINVEGEGNSIPFALNIQYEPTCSPNQQKVYSIAKQESSKIKCSVDAYPTDVDFSWTFNSSGESIDLTKNFVTTTGTTSVVTYTPTTDMDYGTLICIGTNQVGKQRVPCVYHILAAGRPEQIQNCSLINISLTTLTVTCSDGFNGGLPQLFALELKDAYTNETRAYITSTSPRFTVASLNPGNIYTMSIYAFNAKGKSDPTIINAALLQLPEKQSTSDNGGKRKNHLFPPAASLILGLLLALVVAGLAVILALRIPCTKPYSEEETSKAQNFLREHFYGQSARIAESSKTGGLEVDDNPDIVAEILDLENETNQMARRQYMSTVQTCCLKRGTLSSSLQHEELRSSDLTIQPLPPLGNDSLAVIKRQRMSYIKTNF